MTYGEFFRQLYHSIMGLTTDAKKLKVGVLEKNCEVSGELAERILRTKKMWRDSEAVTTGKEDLIYILCGEQGFEQILCWSIRKLFDRYREEGWQGVLPEIAGVLQKFVGDTGSCTEDLFLRPMNVSRNQQELQNAIYWKMGDMALVLCRFLSSDPAEAVAMKVSVDEMGAWHLEKEVLMTKALLNGSVKMPPRLYHGQDVLGYFDERGGVFMDGEQGVPIVIDTYDRTEGQVGYRLTTSARQYGAIAMFYPGVKERLATLLNGDYYVGFVNIHQVVIHPVRHKRLSDLRAAITHGNRVTETKWVLSEKIYRYLSDRKALIEV